MGEQGFFHMPKLQVLFLQRHSQINFKAAVLSVVNKLNKKRTIHLINIGFHMNVWCTICINYFIKISIKLVLYCQSEGNNNMTLKHFVKYLKKSIHNLKQLICWLPSKLYSDGYFQYLNMHYLNLLYYMYQVPNYQKPRVFLPNFNTNMNPDNADKRGQAGLKSEPSNKHSLSTFYHLICIIS